MEMTEAIFRIVCLALAGVIVYAFGYNTGHRDAENIATGKTRVKASNDFMRGLRKGDEDGHNKNETIAW